MTVSTIAAEVAALTTAQEAGIINLGVRDRVILKVAKTAIDLVSTGAATLASGKIFVGNSNNVSTAVTPSGVIAVSTAGVVSFSSNFATASTTDTNGEIAITGMTTNGIVLAVPNESAASVHVVPAAGKVTVFEAGTTNVISTKKFAVLVLSK